MSAILGAVNWASVLPWILGAIGVIWGAVMHFVGSNAKAKAATTVAQVQLQQAVTSAITAQKASQAIAVAADAAKQAQAVPAQDLNAALKAQGALRD